MKEIKIKKKRGGGVFKMYSFSETQNTKKNKNTVHKAVQRGSFDPPQGLHEVEPAAEYIIYNQKQS